MTAAAAKLPAVSVDFLCLCRPCAKLQCSLADLHRAQAAVQLGRLASGASCAGPIRAFGRDPRLLAGVACTFGADQLYRRRQDLPLDGGGLGRYALIVLFPNPLEVC